MLRYISRGFIAEQAIRSLLDGYIKSLALDSTLKGVHVTVTTDHPFVRLLMSNSYSVADAFPSIVVSTQEDRKPSDLMQMPPHIEAIGITSGDIDTITAMKASGLCIACGKDVIDELKTIADKQGMCYGYSIRTWRQDALGVEIWAENSQLKNELYEQVRLYITGELRRALEREYPFFATNVVDTSIVGHRSNNWNYDFGVALSGAHIAFNLDYCTEQLVIDTEATKEGMGIDNEVIQEAHNYV